MVEGELQLRLLRIVLDLTTPTLCTMKTVRESRGALELAVHEKKALAGSSGIRAKAI